MTYRLDKKDLVDAEAFLISFADSAYLSDELTDVKVVLSLLPRPFTTAMIASAMPAAIKPYSIAVAPDSSFRKRVARFFMRMYLNLTPLLLAFRRYLTETMSRTVRTENCPSVNPKE
jgi:hypothetical protein